MPLTNEKIETALKITGHFEDSEDPFGGVSGDFDEMGISLGVLQWNIGSGSLQPLVKNVGKIAVITAMPKYGDDLWNACNSNIPKGLAIVRAWQTGSTLKRDVKAELKAFTHGKEFVTQQIAAAEKVAKRAWDAAVDWNNDLGKNEPSLREFCWFFDVMTQNGGLKEISPTDVQQFINEAGTNKADDVVCDWLASRTFANNGFKDSRKNALLWRDQVSNSDITLFVASYLRSQKSNAAWRADVLNRKGTIALGTGWVHGEKHNLPI